MYNSIIYSQVKGIGNYIRNIDSKLPISKLVDNQLIKEVKMSYCQLPV